MSKQKSSFPLRSNEKKMVASIATHFEKEQYSTFVERTLDSTGVSRRTLFNIRKELRETGTLTSPTRPSSREAYKPIDSFAETAILNKVRKFYSVRRQLPTPTKLHAVLKADISYPGIKSHLRTTLAKIGFTWRKTFDNRKVIVERPAVVAQRLAFYEKRQKLIHEGFTIVYTDDTWVDTSSTVAKC